MEHTFSIITPVYDPPLEILSATIESVLAQSYVEWELCLVDDASSTPGVWDLLERYAAADNRIRIARRTLCGGISEASNDALKLATKEFVVFLDHDDLLVRDALGAINHELIQRGPADFCYSDEAKLFPDGRIREPFYKPDWSPERMRSQMYTGHVSVMRRALVEQVGGFRPEFDGSQDYDLVLRITELTDRILHVAQVLYLWRLGPRSAAGQVDAKPYVFEAARRGVQEHCDRVGIEAIVEAIPEAPGHLRLRRSIRGEPLVSVVIPTRGGGARVHGEYRVHVLHAVASLLERSTYKNVEIVVVVDRDTPPQVIADLQRIGGARVRIVWFDGPFNFSSKVNVGVASTTSEMLILLNDDVEVITPEWIEVMIGLAQEADCGLVGCKLLFADGTLQHGGHVYAKGAMYHAYSHFPGSFPGMANLLGVERECSGVTAACAATRRDVWDAVGGFSETLPVNFNDVDFSLKIRRLGLRVVWTPRAVLYHYESLTRTRVVGESEITRIRQRWGHQLSADPYYNPNLNQERSDWVVEKPPEAWAL